MSASMPAHSQSSLGPRRPRENLTPLVATLLQGPLRFGHGLQPKYAVLPVVDIRSLGLLCHAVSHQYRNKAKFTKTARTNLSAQLRRLRSWETLLLNRCLHRCTSLRQPRTRHRRSMPPLLVRRHSTPPRIQTKLSLFRSPGPPTPLRQPRSGSLLWR